MTDRQNQLIGRHWQIGDDDKDEEEEDEEEEDEEEEDEDENARINIIPVKSQQLTNVAPIHTHVPRGADVEVHGNYDNRLILHKNNHYNGDVCGYQQWSVSPFSNRFTNISSC